MISIFNPYVILGALVGALLLTIGSGLYGYSKGKEAILNRLKDDRITIFQDGQKIDNEVLNADDEKLCALLGGCT